ncbi:hypothetical protein V8G54_035404 [Vigna mungo]|uniref:Uncharacterized protein n=1 Tax=Vigna mungo TaxID=3915 RepID=A0AAQ3RFN2_VIGMU
MAIVCIESSLESSGRGGDGGGIGSDSSSGSSGSGSNCTQRSPQGEAERVMETPPAEGDGGEVRQRAQVVCKGRIFHGTPLLLVQGGVTLDPIALAPVGSLPRVDGYDRAGFDMNTQVSSLSGTGLQDFIDQSFFSSSTQAPFLSPSRLLSSATRVLLTASTWPFDCGCSTELVACLIPKSAKNFSSFRSINCRLLCVITFRGRPNLQINFQQNFCTCRAVMVANGSASTHLVK